VCRFSLATTKTWNDKAGAKQSKTSWHKVVIFGKMADVAAKYLHKGQSVYLTGELDYNEYTATDGTKKQGTSIICNHFVMLGKAGDNAAPAAPRARSSEDTKGSAPSASASDYDDDVPF